MHFFTQMALQRTSAQSDTLENVIAQQYDALQELVQPESDPRFIPHLKKVSRGIYDQLAEHLGAYRILLMLIISPLPQTCTSMWLKMTQDIIFDAHFHGSYILNC